MSANIAVWGDSMIPPLAANLQYLMSDRVVYDGTGIGETSTQVTNRLVADTSRHDWITVYWAGGNNISQPDQIKADIARAFASLTPGNSRFLVISQLNEATAAGIRGGWQYPIVLQLDNDLAATYAGHFLDVRTPLIAAYDPSIAQDVIDHNNDVVPSSLRYDEVHLRQGGSSMVAAMVRDFILNHGW